jgi:hypothetical protein
MPLAHICFLVTETGSSRAMLCEFARKNNATLCVGVCNKVLDLEVHSSKLNSATFLCGSRGVFQSLYQCGLCCNVLACISRVLGFKVSLGTYCPLWYRLVFLSVSRKFREVIINEDTDAFLVITSVS